MKRRLHTALLAAAWLLSHAVNAQVPDPDPARFTESIETFASWDEKNSFPGEATLFVGSSSVRFWKTVNAFPGRPIINRGFGGAELSDVIHFYDQVIKKYSPSRIFLYAGDNDIAHGKTAEQVFEDYRELVSLLQEDLPESQLIFISIKPSKERWALWPAMVKANHKVRDFASHHANLGYADLATPLLNSEGQPKDVFVEDGLHLNESGYSLWREALKPYVD